MSKTVTINMKLLAATMAFASVDPARYYIQGVLLEVGAHGVYYVATDGHRAMISHKPAEYCHPLFAAQIIVPAIECKRIKIGKRSVEDAELTFNDDGTCTVEHPDLTYTFTPVDGTFPDWRRIVPADSKGKAQAHWNHAYAQSFQKFAADMDLGQAVILQRDAESAMPVVFSNAECRSFGILMPIRDASHPGEKWTPPEWINPKPAQLAAAE